MSAVPHNDTEAAPPVATSNGNGVPPTLSNEPAAAAKDTTNGDPVITPAPTKVDAYKPRGIGRSKQSPLAIAHVLLRLLTAVFTLIAFAVVASDSVTFRYYSSTFGTFVRSTAKFNDFFFLSYLLTVNVLTFAYAIVTLVLSVVLLRRSRASKAVFIAIFVLDQIFSYLLISAASSAATGVRVYHSTLDAGNTFSKSYASIAFTFLAFFVLAGAALISGFQVALQSRNL